MPVGALLDGAARRFGDRVAFRHHDRTLTFTGLWRAACGFAHHLQARGVVPGDVVGVHLPNVLAFPVAYYGILLAGATFTPGQPAAAARRRRRPARGRRGGRGGRPGDVGAGVPLIATDGVGFRGVGRDAEAPPVVDLDPTVARAHLAYTGGTTGSPKGVVLTHANVVTNVLQYACHASGSRPVPGVGGEVTARAGRAGRRSGRSASARAPGIAVAPWFHAMGTVGGIGVAVASRGRRASCTSASTPPASWPTSRPTGRRGHRVPRRCSTRCSRTPRRRTRDLTSVRTVTSGAAPMPLALAERLAERMPEAVIVEGYGMTEATMGLTFGVDRALGAPPGRHGRRPGARHRDPHRLARTRPRRAGEAGEVWARGPQVMAGYLDRPEATAETLVDGWLRTGDIGVLGEDGQLEIVDRAKDMLLYKGYNVYPRELEELLAARPEVAAAAVVGRADPAVGEEPVAVVVPARATSPPRSCGAPSPRPWTSRSRPTSGCARCTSSTALPVSAAGQGAQAGPAGRPGRRDLDPRSA